LSGSDARLGLSEALGIWASGVHLGLKLLPRSPIQGAKRILLPVSYWRTAEFIYASRKHASLPSGATAFDLGSPKELPAFLSRWRGLVVRATDILQSAVIQGQTYSCALFGGVSGDRFLAELQDGRSLTYADGTFDAAFSISVIEHIPGTGDSDAVRELVRVVRPGGKVVITVPFDRRYRETFVPRPVYERERVGDELVFFERHYDQDSLARRILLASDAEVAEVVIWGEGRFRGERMLTRLGKLRSILAPFEALLAWGALHTVNSASNEHPMAAFITLRKPIPR